MMDLETKAPRLRTGARTKAAHGNTVFRLGREDEALRAEFLSLDQLTRHGHTLANWHQVATRPRQDRLLPGLAENAVVLREVYELANAALSEGRTIVPAAEWLLDNFYIIESHVRMARQHLPRGYSLELPQLVGGPGDGRPRVYDIAMELISHADGLLDAENLRHFVAAYQTVTPLKLGELWAIPIMLRLALLENLRRIAMRIAWQQQDRDTGAYWAGQVLDALERDPKQVIVVLADLIKSEPVVSNSFVAEYTQRLQGRVGQVPVAVGWLDQWLLEHGQTVERLVHLNSQAQAADQVSMGNSITSLRALGALDWKQFVEEQSYVDRVLRSEPVDVYRKMSFASRDRYRHAIERVAKRSPRSEIQVARVAVELAQEAQQDHPESAEQYRKSRDFEPDHHIGYYLVDDGRSLLEKSVGFRRSIIDHLQRFGSRFRLPLFVGGMLAIWAAMLSVVMAIADAQGVLGTSWSLAWLVPLLLLAVYGSQFSVSLINWLCGFLAPPRTIEQLDFSEEIPIECRTIVVVPTMLTSERGLESLLEQLEVRFLANRDRNLYFALLTDFGDADHATQPADQQLIDLARQGIELLNQKYAGDRKDTFFLFHRPRVYNEQEGVWMGRERKRGKLTDFNMLLCGGRADAFSVIVGNILPLSTVRYVITLDTDTQLPRDTAQKLIGCMAHPLNRPQFDQAKGCVTRGYAVLQPRVAVTIPEGTRSNYSRMFAGDPGIDPYTNQVSNVYQDVFGEGSFIGKGIYDLHAFESALHGRFPDNCVLSHDLIESCFARSGLVSELELFEGFPSRYLADASRRHRWVRGDWQLFGWLLPQVPHAQGKVPSPLSWLAWWKLFDNLRRSLMPPTLLCLLIAAWLLAPGAAVFWTVTALGLIFLPMLIGALPGLIHVPDEMPVRLHLKAKVRDLFKQVLQEVFVISVLPYEAHWNLDAVIRTLYRMCVSRKRLLEWTTASDAERRASGNLASHYELMFAQTVTSLGLVAAIILWTPAAMPAAAPILLLWLIGPSLAWWLSQPVAKRHQELSSRQRQHLRNIARRTWHYFDTFVTERDHWLAPDNFQEDPNGVLATRTSPTNIGMGLIANLTAWDLGYLPTGQVVERIGRTLSVLEQMDHFRGHLYNWYDTRTLQPIEPRYISSVDSGNLAGVLLVLKAGLEDLGDQPILRPEMFDGLADTLRIAIELWQARSTSTESASTTTNVRDVTQRLDRLLAECRPSTLTLSRAHRLLDHMASAASELAGNLSAAGDQRAQPWVKMFEAQCRDFDGELVRLAPWLTATHPGPDFNGGTSHESRERVDQILQLIEKLDDGCSVNGLGRRAGEIHRAIEDLVSAKPSEPRNGQIMPGASVTPSVESSGNHS